MELHDQRAEGRELLCAGHPVSEEPRLPLSILGDDGRVEEHARSLHLVADDERPGKRVVARGFGPDAHELRVLVAEPAKLGGSAQSPDVVV
jgi:hypothetical protein